MGVKSPKLVSPKLIRWVGGVRCLGLFPKKTRFFWTPSLSQSRVFNVGIFLEKQTGFLYFHVFTVSPDPPDRNCFSILMFYQSPIIWPVAVRSSHTIHLQRINMILHFSSYRLHPNVQINITLLRCKIMIGRGLKSPQVE